VEVQSDDLVCDLGLGHRLVVGDLRHEDIERKQYLHILECDRWSDDNRGADKHRLELHSYLADHSLEGWRDSDNDNWSEG
jgi:hypothetical protein